ncbi:hypothetical protein J2J97_32185 (plasmid) [Rhizobium bangladeshense]|uniref:hypothetical protein n=1 Tax=Rhizobium bangladeshense TaxID=1138189 RepID=UPI001A98DB19|nr:hypothetical protein [Rhizobium bangladeshense]QSY98565.1 hypothetical protein J2J97_32185 [Rhizobium bangladeshense]
MTAYFGVYRVTRSGEHYVSRSATHSEKLAKEIAADLSAGEITMPDGSIKYVKPAPHIAKEIAR